MIKGSVEEAIVDHGRDGFACVLVVNRDGSWCWRIWDRSFSGDYGDVSLEQAVRSWLEGYKDLEAFIAERQAG